MASSSATPPPGRRASGRRRRGSVRRRPGRTRRARGSACLIEVARRCRLVSAWSTKRAQERRRVRLELLAELARGWRGCRACRPAGCRSAPGCSAPAGRRRRISSRAPALLDQDLRDPVEAGDVLAEDVAVLLHERRHLGHAPCAEVAQRGRAAPGARRPACWRRCRARSLKLRTVLSFFARVLMKPSSCRAEPNSSSLLSSRVALSLPKFLIVWWNWAPSPPKFFGGRLQQVGQRAVLVGAGRAERDGQVVDGGVDLVELERDGGAVGAEHRAVADAPGPRTRRSGSAGCSGRRRSTAR